MFIDSKLALLEPERLQMIIDAVSKSAQAGRSNARNLLSTKGINAIIIEFLRDDYDIIFINRHDFEMISDAFWNSITRKPWVDEALETLSGLDSCQHGKAYHLGRAAQRTLQQAK